MDKSFKRSAGYKRKREEKWPEKYKEIMPQHKKLMVAQFLNKFTMYYRP